MLWVWAQGTGMAQRLKIEHPESDQILSAQMAGPTPKGLLFTNRIDMDRPYTPSLCWFQIANMVLRISHFKWLEKCFGRTHLENRRTSLTQALGLRDVRKRAWSFCFFGVDLWGGEWSENDKLPSGKLTVCYWKWPFIVDYVDLPIKNSDFP